MRQTPPQTQQYNENNVGLFDYHLDLYRGMAALNDGLTMRLAGWPAAFVWQAGVMSVCVLAPCEFNCAHGI